jgi:predicted phage terminase large subunit-like protein
MIYSTTTKQRARALLLLQEYEQATAQTALSFRDFVTRVRPQYQWYRHCEVLADVLQQVADGTLKRLMVFCPPRHGKSEAVSRLFTAYFIYRYPAEWVGLCSYSAELAYTLSRNARDNYREAGGMIREDASAVKQWQTPQGGGLWAAGVGGSLTGRGGTLLITDDPLKNAEEAQSEVIREKHKDWYESTFRTRAEPNAAMVIVQTRWHEDDLSGYLLSSEVDHPEYWTIVNLPAIAEEPASFPATCNVLPDWRQEGEALCPERFPRDVLDPLAATNDYFFSALYQQRPRPKSGAMFKRQWFEIVGAAPRQAMRVRYFDKAGAEPGKGDYTVGCLMARDAQGIFYIEDVVRGQWSAHARNEIIRQTAQMDKQKYGDSVHTVIEQPPGLAKESTDTVVRMLAGFHVSADKVMKDKVSRAEPFADQCEAQNVKVVAGEYLHAYFQELESFPLGKHDDQVDASSGAFNRLVLRAGRQQPAQSHSFVSLS